MDVSCPACSARYTANDEKLRGKTARMRCKACNTVWMVAGEPAAPKRAAVVKKGAERDGRDLFAVREPDVGSLKTFDGPPPSLGSSGVGARNENSVLFRVDQLMSTGRVKTPAPSTTERASRGGMTGGRPTLGGDDEGVIDLHALSAVARPVATPLAPLFSEAPPAVAVDVNAPLSLGNLAASKKGLALTVGGAVAFVMTAALGLSFLFKGEQPIEHTATAALVAPVETAAPPPVVTPPAPLASVDTTDAAETPKETKGKKSRGKGKGSRSVATAIKGQSAAPKPMPKAANPCGCNGDFNCILACTAKGKR
jgi:predicted Zn finger-like uncharacterized protein